MSQLNLGSNPLDGFSVHVRTSHREPYVNYGNLLRESLARYGAEIRAIDDLSLALDLDHSAGPLDTIDAFLMLAWTVAVSAEAIELAHRPRKGAVAPREKLHVLMPKDFEKGFIRKRLEKHGVSIDLFEEQDVTSGLLCCRTVLTLAQRLRQEKALEKARKEQYNPKIGIVTALSIEFEAMTSLLDEKRTQTLRPQAGNYSEFVHGKIASLHGGQHEVVVVRSGMGNNNSAMEADRLFQTFSSLDEVFVVGIAGGLPSTTERHDDIRLGDVVVSGRKGVVQYDMIKKTVSGNQANHSPRPPSDSWLRRTETLINSADEMTSFRKALSSVAIKKLKRPAAKTDVLWDDTEVAESKAISRKRDAARVTGQPMVFQGVIGSANAVVKDQAQREEIRDACGAIAVEMEGSGVADAATRNGKPFFVVRGICDYANRSKNDAWHNYAAMAAAVFTLSLVRSMPLVASDNK